MLRYTLLLLVICITNNMHTSEEPRSFSINCIEPNFEGQLLQYQATIPRAQIHKPLVIKSIIRDVRYDYILNYMRLKKTIGLFDIASPRIGACTIHMYGFHRQTAKLIDIENITWEMLATNAYALEAQIYREEDRY